MRDIAEHVDLASLWEQWSAMSERGSIEFLARQGFFTRAAAAAAKQTAMMKVLLDSRGKT